MTKAPPLPAPTDLIPRTEHQAEYITHLQNSPLVFAVGPAGTGKTYLAVQHAVNLLCQLRIKRIVVTRPMVAAEDEVGILPGGIYEKFEPYFIPVLEVLNQLLTPPLVRQLIAEDIIVIAPLAYLRGRTFHRSCVLLDEAQNVTPKQMKLFLSRIGEKSQMILSGDLDQMDIEGMSGLEDALYRLHNLEEVGHVDFDEEDIVRSALCKKIMKTFK